VRRRGRDRSRRNRARRRRAMGPGQLWATGGGADAALGADHTMMRRRPRPRGCVQTHMATHESIGWTVGHVVADAAPHQFTIGVTSLACRSRRRGTASQTVAIHRALRGCLCRFGLQQNDVRASAPCDRRRWRRPGRPCNREVGLAEAAVFRLAPHRGLRSRRWRNRPVPYARCRRDVFLGLSRVLEVARLSFKDAADHLPVSLSLALSASDSWSLSECPCGISQRRHCAAAYRRALGTRLLEIGRLFESSQQGCAGWAARNCDRSEFSL